MGTDHMGEDGRLAGRDRSNARYRAPGAPGRGAPHPRGGRMRRGGRVPLRTDLVVSPEPACTSSDDGARLHRSPGTGTSVRDVGTYGSAPASALRGPSDRPAPVADSIGRARGRGPPVPAPGRYRSRPGAEPTAARVELTPLAVGLIP